MRRSVFSRSPFSRHQRHILRWVLLAAALLAVLMLAYGCMAHQLMYSARGTMVFLPEMPTYKTTGGMAAAIPPVVFRQNQ